MHCGLMVIPWTDTIPLLAVWPVSVSYHHSVVGISFFFGTVNFWWELSFDKLAGTPFFNNLEGTPFFLQKEGWVNHKGGHCPPIKGKKGSSQIFNTKTYQLSFPLISVCYCGNDTKITQKVPEIPAHHRNLQWGFAQLRYLVIFIMVFSREDR